MIKYSAGYIKLNPNFVIQNIDQTEKCDEATFSILNNIYTRGCPTIPSRALRRAFDEPSSKYSSFTYCLDFNNLNWTDNTIKGGGKTNPAYEFYKRGFSRFADIDPKYVGSFIPECPLKDVLYKYVDDPNIDKHLDFYSPIYKTDIEVDGPQHKEKEQKTKDQERDNELKKYGIKVIRIPAYFYRYFTKRHIEPQPGFQNLIDSLEYVPLHDISYMFAIRLEMLFLNLYMSKKISLDANELYIYLHTYPNIGGGPAKIIIEDFYDYLTEVFKLQNIDFKSPEKIHINFCKTEDELSGKSGINIDISLTQVYSETKYGNIYYIRNDYFQYEDKRYFIANNLNDTYSFKKNYYQISHNYVEYHLTSEHDQALTFLLVNTSKTGDYDNGFRENQIDIIKELLNNTSAIGVLPTGAGKSLCYQLCSMLIPSMTLVVAPLQLLMLDQVKAASKHFGITNTAIINSMTRDEKEIVYRGQSLITIVSPERFFSYGFSEMLYHLKPIHNFGFLVIDEVHCLSEWGHDFRTSYLCLSHNLSNYFDPDSTYLLTLTGTASYRVLEDVELELEQFKKKKIRSIFADNMERDELNIHVEQVAKYYDRLKEIVQESVDDGLNKKMLIFTSATSETKETGCVYISNKLIEDFKSDGLENFIATYMGGRKMPDKDKKKILDDFSMGDKKIVVATKAFGMGVDIQDIRTTINCGLPSSVESLYQEIGRAGRDKNPADCYILYKKDNDELINKLYSNKFITMKDIDEVRNNVDELRINLNFIYYGNMDLEQEEEFVTLIYKKIQDFLLNPLDYDTDKQGLSVDDFKEVIKGGSSSVAEIANRSEEVFRSLVEKSLYRLYLLGEIDMWKVVYDAELTNPTFTDLSLTSYTDDEKVQRVKNHIDRYKTNSIYVGTNSYEDRLIYLIKWVNENYLQSRIQTIKTLYDACQHYRGEGEFMKFLNDYFSVDEVYDKLRTADEVNTDDVIEVLKTPVLNAKPRIARLLESYDKKPSINYVSGIVRLRLGEFADPDGRDRLEYALSAIKNSSSIDKDQRNELFGKTYELIEDEYRDLFVSTWINCIHDDVKYIFKRTQNNLASEIILEDVLKEE